MTLHVGGNLEEAAHKGAGTQVAEHILLVVEQGLHQTLRMGVFVAEVLPAEFAIVACFFYQAIPRLVQIILKRLAHVIVETGCGIGGCQFLTFGNHREDTTVNNRRTCIDGYVLGFEDLWEILGQTFADAVMLALTDSRQVTQTFDGCRLKGLDLPEHFLAEWGQLVLVLGIAEDISGACIAVVTDQPTGTVTAVVAHIVRLVSLRGRGEGLVWKSAVIIQILTARQILVGLDFFAGSLC